ncbi:MULTISPECIES: porin [Paraburkholderia]|uniref:Outer membrane protein (Porin) n=1 Tax=Paraburkholderia phenazinium TaxID=60549 RepID=A0A1N6JZS7_9BURK|nr:Outer membrane protein (porin) [Paraburkholderia phenazinium]SIO49749.1 Outer membrane protein (porin) [Paraburkholderia phenazinium]
MSNSSVNLKISAIALSCAFFTLSAQAQSTVTLYGALDEGLDYVTNSGGHSLWRMRDGTYDGVYGSRWGLKGSEDLGGGLSAIFKLEAGFSVENGQMRQGGLEFGRQAYVGLSDDKYGTLTFGRQYDPVVDFLQPMTAGGQFGGPFVHSGDIDNTDNSFRVDNAIKYASPKIAGVTFGGMYSFSNTNAVGRSTTGLWGLGASYSFGQFNFGGAYEYIKDPGALLTDGDYVPNTTGAGIGATGPFSYVGQPASQQIVGAGVSYLIGNTTLGLDFSDTNFKDANGTTSSVRFDNYEAFVRYAISPAFSVGGAYTYTHGKVNYSGQVPIYQSVGLATSYALSKSTSLYAMAVWQKAVGGAGVADILDGAVGDASTNNHQSVVRIGIYHLF